MSGLQQVLALLYLLAQSTGSLCMSVKWSAHVYQISDLPTDNLSCKAVQVYDSSGLALELCILSNNADSVEEMEYHTQPCGVIECCNNAAWP
jgi:hypothetical protein